MIDPGLQTVRACLLTEIQRGAINLTLTDTDKLTEGQRRERLSILAEYKAIEQALKQATTDEEINRCIRTIPKTFEGNECNWTRHR